MCKNIVNPITNRKVLIKSKLGKSIISNYSKYVQRGGNELNVLIAMFFRK